MALTISDISAVLKRIIRPVIEGQLRKESLLFDKVKRNVGVTVANNQVFIAARTGRHSGIYTVAEGVEPRSGKAKYQQPNTTIKFAFGTLELTDQAIEAASGGSVKSIASILSTEIMALKDDIRMDLNRQFHGDATGKLCLANGAGSATTALTIDGHPAGLDASDYLSDGMFISIGGGPAREIASVDSATGVTLSTADTWADDDVIKKVDASEMMGLAGIIDDGDNVATIQNITRSSNPWSNSFVDDTSETLTELMMIDLYLKTRRHGGANVIFAGESLFSKYGSLITSLKRTANLKEILSGGWKGLEFMGGDVGVFLDPDTWTGYMQFVNFNALTIAQLTKPFQWLEADAHGGILKRSSSNRTVWEGTLKYYAELVGLRFKAHGRLRQKTA